MEALKLKKDDNPIYGPLKLIQHNVSPYAVAAGGAVTDYIFNCEYGKSHFPRDIDIFLPLISKNGKLNSKRYRKKLERLGLTGYHEEFGVKTEKYSANMHGMVYSVYKGKLAGVDVDVVLILNSEDQIWEYVKKYFDIDIKIVAFDGNNTLRSREFNDALSKGTVGMVHPHSPLSTFFRIMDATERYGLEPDKSFYFTANYAGVERERLGDFEWRKNVRSKYSYLLGRAEKVIKNLGKLSYTEACILDTMHGWSMFPATSKNALYNYLNGVKEVPAIEIEKIYNPEARIWPKKSSAKDFQSKAEELELDDSLINNEDKVILGCGYKEVVDRLIKITQNEYFTSKLEMNGQVVRVGKVLNKIKKYWKRNLNENHAKSKTETLNSLKHLLENRLTQPRNVEFLISRDKEDLVKISINTPWESCQSWKPGQLTAHNRHLAANLNGLTAVAVLRCPKTKKWLARCLLRLSKKQRAVIYEKSYGVHPDYASGLVDIIENELMHRDITVTTRRKATFSVGPFYLQPYGYAFINLPSCFKKDIKHTPDGAGLFFIRKLSWRTRNPRRYAGRANNDRNKPGPPF